MEQAVAPARDPAREMSILRAALGWRRTPHGPPAYLNPANYADLESYAYGLMRHGVATDIAREALRAAKRRSEMEAVERPPDALGRAREAAERRREAQASSAAAAARVLLAQIGWRDGEEEFDDDWTAPPLWREDGQSLVTADPRWGVWSG